MVKSISSWICGRSGIQAHISMISNKAGIFLLFSIRFMTKRKHSGSTDVRNSSSSKIWIFLLFSTRFMAKIKKNSESRSIALVFFKGISQRIITVVTKTRYKTFQVWIFTGISQRIVRERRTISLSPEHKNRNKTFQVRFFRGLSQRIINERKTWLSRLWSGKISSSLWSRGFSSSNGVKWFLSLWLTGTWLSSLWSREISISDGIEWLLSLCQRELWLLSFWQNEISLSLWSWESLSWRRF